MIAARVRRHGTHLGGVAADNALSSASNFLSSVVALRVSGADGFAAAGICLVLVRISVAVSRSYSVEPLVTAAPAARTVSLADATSTLATATTSGIALAALGLLYLKAFSVPLTGGLLILMSIGLVTMCQGEALRSLFLFRCQYRWALWYDGIWLGLLVAAVPFLIGSSGPGAVLAAWSLTGAAAMVVMLPLLGRSLDAPTDPPAATLTARTRAGIAGETAMDRTSNQLSIAVIATAASPALATGITAARTVLSPLNPALFALFNFLVPVTAGFSNERRRSAIGSLMVGAPLTVLAVATMVVLTPAGALELVVGPAWRNARPVFLPVSLLFASAMVRQLVLAIARGGGVFGQARPQRYLASALAFAPCLLAGLGGRWVLLSLYLVTISSLVGALLVGRSIANVLKDRELAPC